MGTMRLSLAFCLDPRKASSTNGVFANVVAAADGLLVRTRAPSAADTPNITSFYSGSKSGYGINVQATCDSNYRFCQVSAISPGATNDWNAWNRSSLSKAVDNLPDKYCILGDAAYPLSEKLLTPYPGKGLDPGYDSYNFHLSQLRVKIEQSFGILVSVWGILWRPLRVQFAGRTGLITALFHLHNFLRDERDEPINSSDEDENSGLNRPVLEANNTLPSVFHTVPAPSRSGETGARCAIRWQLEQDKQWRPEYNLVRNS